MDFFYFPKTSQTFELGEPMQCSVGLFEAEMMRMIRSGPIRAVSPDLTILQ